MKKHISEVGSRYYRKLSVLMVAALLAFAGMAPAIMFGSSSVGALGGQVTTRSITMSNSAPSATGVTYTVTFTPVTTVANPDVVIDFCANDPLYNDSTCTASVGSTTPTVSAATASTGWTISTLNSNRTVYLTTSTLNATSGTPLTITLSNITNPSTTAGPFYARILTYSPGAGSTYTPSTLGSVKDFGGIALTTTQSLTVTSKVFETIAFCVYQTSCGTQAQLQLGNTSTDALSTTTAYANSNGLYSIATNASHGVSVTMTGQTLCNQATLNLVNCPTGASANTITAAGATPVVSAVGTSQFGMCAYNGGNSSITIATTYNDTVNNCNGITTGSYSGTSKFGFDNTSATGTNSAGGSQVLSSTGPLASTSGNFTFLGNIAATTTAGIYTSNLNMVATGTF